MCRCCNGVRAPPLLPVGIKIHRDLFWPRARPRPPENGPLCRFSLRSCTASQAPPRSDRVAHTFIVPQNCSRPCCTCSRTAIRLQFRACPGPLSCATCWRNRYDIRGACQHCADQVYMVGGLRVHGCVNLIHMIVTFDPYGWVQCMNDETIR